MVSTLGFALDWTLTSYQDIAPTLQKTYKTGKMRYASWYNRILGYNNNSETVLIALVMN